MSKYKITKKNVNKKTMFSFVPLILFVLMVMTLFLLGYFAAKKTSQPHTHENEITVELPEEHEHEESHGDTGNTEEESFSAEEKETYPAPDAEAVNTVQMGDNIRYTLYTDGTLLVTGSGSTWDFDAPMSSKDFIAESLGVTRGDITLDWFYPVRTIVIEDSITILGDCSLSMYKYAEKVMHKGILESVGSQAFFSCGSRSESNVIWKVSFTEAEVARDAFDKCKNYPEGYEPEISEEH